MKAKYNRRMFCENNWRVSEAKRLIEEIQLMTNAIESIKQRIDDD